MYDLEHEEFFAAIRKGERKADEEWVAHSTMMALLGRESCYSGKKIKWDDFAASGLKLVPDDLKWDQELPIRPMPIPGVAETQRG